MVRERVNAPRGAHRTTHTALRAPYAEKEDTRHLTFLRSAQSRNEGMFFRFWFWFWFAVVGSAGDETALRSNRGARRCRRRVGQRGKVNGQSDGEMVCVAASVGPRAKSFCARANRTLWLCKGIFESPSPPKIVAFRRFNHAIQSHYSPFKCLQGNKASPRKGNKNKSRFLDFRS